MSAIYLIDTNILSDMMRDPDGQTARRFRQIMQGTENASLCTSVIVQCELLFGIRRRTNPRWAFHYKRVVESVDVLPLESNVVSHYASLRTFLESAGTPMSANDLLIAAHALTLNATLVSADAAFARVPGLKFENWLS